MFNIILILFAFVIAQVAGEPGIREHFEWRALSGDNFSIALSCAAALALFYVTGIFIRLIIAARLKAQPAQRDALYAVVRHIAAAYKVFLIALYAVILVPLNWFSFCEIISPPQHIVFAHFLLKLLPFAVLMLLSWLIYFQLEKLFSFRSWTLRQYMSFQIRQTAVILLPLLGFQFVFEAFERVQFLEDWLTLYPELVIVGFVPMMAIVYTLIPILARFVWTVESFPKGHLRGRLEKMCKDNGVKIRDILLWRTGRASIINAAALGLFGPFRYVIITDGLLQHLNDSEVEAVFGHELGHAKYHHIATYAAFLIIISFLTTVIMGVVTPITSVIFGANEPVVDTLLQLVLTFGIFIGIVFGFISRRFERQADVFGCKAVGDTMTFVNALEKVALFSGNVRSLRSWMHSSIEKRVKFLIDASHYPEIGRRFQTKVRALAMGITGAFALCLLGLTASIFLNPYDSRILRQASAYESALAQTRDKDQRLALQLMIAGEYEKAAKYTTAARYYDQAFRDEIDAENVLRAQKDDKATAKNLRDTGRLFLKEGFPETAAPMIAMAVRFEPDNAENAALTGDLAKAYMDNIDELIAQGARDVSYLDVTNIAPAKNDRLLRMAAARAMSVFHLAAATAPEDAQRKAMLARAYLLTGNYGDAAALYKSIVETSASPETLIWWGVAAAFTGDAKTAQEMLFVRAANAPDRALLEEARRRAALAFAFTAPPEELRRLFAEWGRLDTGSARFAHFAAAESLFDAGEDAAAVSAYRAAIGAFPENPYYRYRLGEVYLSMGKNVEAAQQFQRAAMMRASNVPIRKDFLLKAAAARRLSGQPRRADSLQSLAAPSGNE